MENCRGMEKDRNFCGSMSTTRSHTRNQDTPQWNKRFVSMAAHFGAVTVAITEIGLLKCFNDSHWQVLSFVLTVTQRFAIFLFFVTQEIIIKQKKNQSNQHRPLKKKEQFSTCPIAQYEDGSKT